MNEQLTDEELQKALAAQWNTLPPAHPAAETFDMMSDAEIDEMAADIKKNGLREPIVFWVDNREKKNGAQGPFPLFLLDGRNRAEALRRLGDADIIKPNYSFSDKSCSTVREVRAIRQEHSLTCADLQKGKWVSWVDPWEFVWSANYHRRHLTLEAKRAAIAKFIKERPQASNRKIAKMAKVDDKTVAKVRRETVQNAEVPRNEHLPIERAKEAVRKYPDASTRDIAELVGVVPATAQRAKNLVVAESKVKPGPVVAPPPEPEPPKPAPATEPPSKPEPEESLEEPPPREPEIQKMSEEDIRKWVKSLWADYGRKRLTPGKLSQGAFKILVSHVLYKTSTPPVWKVIIGIMNAEV